MLRDGNLFGVNLSYAVQPSPDGLVQAVIIGVEFIIYAGNMSTLAPIMDNPQFRFVKADICDRDAVYKLFEEEQPDMVVNFAAESHVDRSIENPEVFLDTNIKGIAVLMDACRKYSIKRYHQISMDEVYDLPGSISCCSNNYRPYHFP